MRFRFLLLIALIACVPRVSWGQGSESPGTGDLARLQGTWKSDARPGMVELILKVQGAATRVESKGVDGRPVVIEARLTLDETANPRTWTSTRRILADGGPAPDVKALYELSGDVLRICSNGPGKPRPTEFRAGADGLPIVVRFHRVKNSP